MRTPTEILVNPANKTVALEPDLRAAIPGLARAFEGADHVYEADRLAHLQDLKRSVFSFPQHRSTVNCSLICNERTAQSEEMLVIFAAFADGRPLTSAERLDEYIANGTGSLIDKSQAKPNTWNQTTKSSVTHDVLEALDMGMPVLTIYSPVPPRAYTREERALIRQGNLSPAAKTGEHALAQALNIINHDYGPPRVNTIHLRGESLGDNALGTAYVLRAKDDEFKVGSVTAQELIMGPNWIGNLAKRYLFKQYVGEASYEQPRSGTTWLPEPQLRQEIDGHGSEPAMYARTLRAMTKLTHLLGLTKPEWLAEKIEYLVDEGVLLLAALAANSSVSHQTPSYLPKHPNLALVTFKAVEGQKVGHLVDEHVAAGVITTALGIKRYKDRAA